MEVERPLPLKAGDGMDLDPGAPRDCDDGGGDEGDLYSRLKALQRQLEFYEIQVSGLVGG
jgi:hypothetical protein